MCRLLKPENVYFLKIVQQKYAFLAKNLYLCMFDAKSHLLGEHRISIGTADQAIFSPREILIVALKQKASFIVLLHNHPSGVPEPSKDDVSATVRVRDAGNLIGIPLMDHIIIGDNTYFSFLEEGLCLQPGGKTYDEWLWNRHGDRESQNIQPVNW